MMAEATDRSLIGLRVLYVEDNALIALNCADAIESLGCSVTTCNSLTEAFGAIAREIPDVGLLDVNVHGETSYEVAEMLERQGVPVAFLTGCMSFSSGQRWENVHTSKSLADLKIFAA